MDSINIIGPQPKDQKQDLDIESGLDFILSHLSEPIFPRRISTKNSNNRQYRIENRQKVLEACKTSNYRDCRISAFPLLKEGKSWVPDLFFIDLDLNDFKNQQVLRMALAKTLSNIQQQLDQQTSPTVLWSGNGYHIIQPIDCPIALEYIKEFQDFDKPSEQFLRFAKDHLSNNKADKRNYPSFRSCLLRIPSSINSKHDTPVRIIQKWNGYRPRITKDLLIEFRGWIIQKKIDENNFRLMWEQERQKRKRSGKIHTNDYYKWIDILLQTGIKDYRKTIVDLILGPYLINVKKLALDESYTIIRKWLYKCDNVNKLDKSINFNHRIKQALNNATSKQIGPMSLERIRTDNRYNKLHLLLVMNKI